MPRSLRPQEINQIFSIFEKANPSPETELSWTNPYTLLVAVVLSAQSTDKGVNKATGPLFQKVDSPQKMIDLGEEGLKTYIKTLGLFNTKAKNILKLSQILLDQHEGQVPESRKDLESLPGVGRKTANVVLSVVFGHPTIAVDTHIFRVSRRMGFSQGKTPLDVEQDLLKKIPAAYRAHAHHWLILHGRYICKAQKPNCPACPVRSICRYDQKTL